MGGTPEKIKAGNVMKLPPPATELSAPPRIAAKKRVRPVKNVIISHSLLALTDFSILLCFIANREKILQSLFRRLRRAHFYVQMSQYLRVFNALHLLLCIGEYLWKTCLNDILNC